VRFLRDPLYRLIPLTLVSALYVFCRVGGVIDGSILADLAAVHGPPYYIVLWAFHDSRRTRFWPSYHYGLYLLVVGVVFVPHYVFATRGRRGFGLAAALWLALWAPSLAGLIGFWLYDDLPDPR
jgi:hypothetical protein